MPLFVHAVLIVVSLLWCIASGNVLKKQPNNDGTSPSAEAVEGRPSTEGNAFQTATLRTQSRVGVSIGLQRVREVARRDRRAQFTALTHHITPDLLRTSFFTLKRDAAAGVDGMTWHQYETDLEERLPELYRRVHAGTYRAQPSKRTFIPKSDGRQRPRPTCGRCPIASLEDKIVQQAVVTVLNQIYEVDFKGFSYGFRPGRSQHDALDAVYVGLMGKKVNWMLDADIQGLSITSVRMFQVALWSTPSGSSYQPLTAASMRSTMNGCCSFSGTGFVTVECSA